MIAVDYPGDPTPKIPPSHTYYRLFAAWLPFPMSAATNLTAYGLGFYDPIRHDNQSLEQTRAYLITCLVLWLTGVILTVRGVWRLKTESDGAFVWAALVIQALAMAGSYALVSLLL